jgi:hypothetical protein
MPRERIFRALLWPLWRTVEVTETFAWHLEQGVQTISGNVLKRGGWNTVQRKQLFTRKSDVIAEDHCQEH